MDNQENRSRYEFARQRQAQNVINEIKGNNDKYELAKSFWVKNIVEDYGKHIENN